MQPAWARLISEINDKAHPISLMLMRCLQLWAWRSRDDDGERQVALQGVLHIVSTPVGEHSGSVEIS